MKLSVVKIGRLVGPRKVSESCRRVVSLDKKIYSTLSLSTQVYKCVVSLDKKLYSTLSLFIQLYKAFSSSDKRILKTPP